MTSLLVDSTIAVSDLPTSTSVFRTLGRQAGSHDSPGEHGVKFLNDRGPHPHDLRPALPAAPTDSGLVPRILVSAARVRTDLNWPLRSRTRNAPKRRWP